MSKVLVPYGERAQLAKIFQVSEKSVYNALSSESNSALTIRIRKAAIERGGALVEDQPKQQIS